MNVIMSVICNDVCVILSDNIIYCIYNNICVYYLTALLQAVTTNIPGLIPTRVGTGVRKYLVDLYVIACWPHCTCKQDVHRLSLVSALSAM